MLNTDQISLVTFAVVLRQFGDYERAKKYYQRISVRSRQQGLNVAQLHHNWGRAHFDAGEYNEALAQHLVALQHVMPSEMIGMVVILTDIAATYQALGNINLAELYCHKAMMYLIKNIVSWNPLHPIIISTCTKLGWFFARTDRSEKAIQMYQKALQVGKATYPKDHPELANIYNNLGGVHKDMKKWNSALYYYELARKISDKVMITSPTTATIYNNIGVVYLSMNDLKVGKNYLYQALKMRLAIMSEDHPDLFTSYANIADVHKAKHEIVLARIWYKILATMTARRLPVGHSIRIYAHLQLGSMYYLLFEWEKSVLFTRSRKNDTEFVQSRGKYG
ncbi:unnamed protein product [Rotaria sp. Silwood2]|nr:unnamed protein product [Rotaria sp. Silwood2]